MEVPTSYEEEKYIEPPRMPVETVPLMQPRPKVIEPKKTTPLLAPVKLKSVSTAFPGPRPMTPDLLDNEDSASYHVPSAYKGNYKKVIPEPKKLPQNKLAA